MEIYSRIKTKNIIYASNVSQLTSLAVVSGDIVKTLGYYSVNDGGGALYKIRHQAEGDVADGGSKIFLSRGNLLAELIEKKHVNVRQFGAKGDGSTNDTTAIQNALNYCKDVEVPEGTYIVTSLELDSAQSFYGVSYKSILKNPIATEEEETINFLKTKNQSSLIKVHDLYLDGNKYNQENIVNGIVVQRDNGTYETEIDAKHHFYNLIIKNFTGDGLDISLYNRDCLFENINIVNCNGIGIKIETTDSKFNNITVGGSGKEGIKFATTANANLLENSKVYYTGYSDNTKTAVDLNSSRNVINNLYIQETCGDGLYIKGEQNTITGLVIDSCGRVIEGNCHASTALWLKSPDDNNHIVRENYIIGSIINGDTNSYAKYGVKIDSDTCFNNYVNVLCNNVRYVTKYPQCMKKYTETFKNFTNEIKVGFENNNRTPIMANGINDCIAKNSFGSITGGSVTYDTENNKASVSLPNVNQFFETHTAGYYTCTIIPYAGTGSAPKKLIAKSKAKVSSNCFRCQLVLSVSYGTNQTARLLFTKNNIFEVNFSEFDDIISYFDLSSYENITYLSLQLNVICEIGENTSAEDVAELTNVTAEFKDLQIDMLYD